MRSQVFYPTIPQSAFVSSIIEIRGASWVGLWSPVVTSCQIMMQVAHDTNSASFVRAYTSTDATAWAFNAATGSAAVSIHDIVGPFPFCRIETSVIQTDVRTFALMVKYD